YQRGRKAGKDAECIVGAARRIGELCLARRLALAPLPAEVLAGAVLVLHNQARSLGRAAGQRRERTAAQARVGRLVAEEGKTWRRSGLAHAALAGGLLAVAEEPVGAARAVRPERAAERTAVAEAAEIPVVALLARVDDAVAARAPAAAELPGHRTATEAEDGVAIRRSEEERPGGDEGVAGRIELTL